MPERRRPRRRRRSGDGRGEAYEVRVRAPKWVDPFPGIYGTVIEKMVMAELYHREVPFHFQYNVRDIPFLPGIENWRVDFYVPSTKTVIEVNGEYWHTLPGAIQKDAFRYAALEAAGYKVVIFWESDVETRLKELCDGVPTLKNPPVKGPPVSMENNIDDARAVRRMNASRRTRVSTISAGTGRQRRRKRRAR